MTGGYYEIDEESLAGWKAAFAKDGVVYQTDEEYYEAIRNFTGFIDTLIEIDRTIKPSDNKDSDRGMYLIDKNGNKIIL